MHGRHVACRIMCSTPKMDLIRLNIVPKVERTELAERAPMVFLDVETDGLYPRKGARIVEIALLSWEQEILFHEGREESEWAETCRYYLENSIVVGHNVLFDLTFVADSFRRNQLSMPCVNFIDTRMVWLQENKKGSSRLNALAKFLGKEDHDWHSARSDAQVCREYLEYLISRQPEITLGNLGLNRWRKGTW